MALIAQTYDFRLVSRGFESPSQGIKIRIGSLPEVSLASFKLFQLWYLSYEYILESES
jgi:hypothetical protein